MGFIITGHKVFGPPQRVLLEWQPYGLLRLRGYYVCTDVSEERSAPHLQSGYKLSIRCGWVQGLVSIPLLPLRLAKKIVAFHSFSSLSYDRSKASSKASSPNSTIQRSRNSQQTCFITTKISPTNWHTSFSRMVNILPWKHCNFRPLKSPVATLYVTGLNIQKLFL
jgi:hypothetical protein